MVTLTVVVAVGALARSLTAQHSYDDAYVWGTPYARLAETEGKIVVLEAPLDTVTFVHHAEAIAEFHGKLRVSYRSPMLVDNKRVWITFHDIDTSEGALPYERVLGQKGYVEHLACAALTAGVGRSCKIGEATAYLFDARGLVEQAVGWIERNFSNFAAEDPVDGP